MKKLIETYATSAMLSLSTILGICLATAICVVFLFGAWVVVKATMPGTAAKHYTVPTEGMSEQNFNEICAYSQTKAHKMDSQSWSDGMRITKDYRYPTPERKAAGKCYGYFTLKGGILVRISQ